MNVLSLKLVRNVGIMAHIDAGKTTATERILYYTHKIHKMGEVHDGSTEMDWMDQERERGITITSAATTCFWNLDKEKYRINIIDTPGHEAFTQLRARGAKLTDIVVLVIAADDGIMPQTREAINHAKAAGIPILVAINKIDKSEADIDKVKQQLSKEGLMVEDWGGEVISVEVSAKEKTNLDELLEMILLLSDVIEIKCNPGVKAQGVVLEARLDAQKGPIATVIIQHGILTQGEAFISGTCHGKTRALFDENGKTLKKAEPSMPVEVLGFSDVPEAGNFFQVVSNIETAKQITSYRLSQVKKEEAPRLEHFTLDDLFKKIEEGEVKELPLVIKTDVQGSVDTLIDILPNLSSEEVKIKIIHSASGKITETDVLLASASNAIIIGYYTKPTQKILDMASDENVEIRVYNVIYQLTEDIKKALSGLLEPTLKETSLGKAEIRRVFQIPRVGAIAGCLVIDGKIARNAEVKIIRDGEVIHKGRISSLKHLTENVTEVTKNYECGIGLEKFKDIQEGDIIEAFLTEKIKRE